MTRASDDWQRILCDGRWERPSDKEAVYTELTRGRRWGIRVVLFGDEARVEAIDAAMPVTYGAPRRYVTIVRPPTLWERLRGITFADKLLRAVAEKRRVAWEEEARLQSSHQGE
ncbi:MAG TPA: hypothetical protein VIK93_10420 [Limnochordales bacterium]